MLSKIKLKICLPGEVFLTEEVDKVQIPALGGDITLLSKRAPSSFLLTSGFIRVLDNEYKEKEKYLVKDGFVDFGAGICRVMTEEITDYKDVNLSDIKKLRDSALSDDDKEKFQRVINLMNTEKQKDE